MELESALPWDLFQDDEDQPASVRALETSLATINIEGRLGGQTDIYLETAAAPLATNDENIFVQNLPLELAMEIFQLVVPHRQFRELSSNRSPVDPPYRTSHAVAQVCRFWRQLALATPELWTDIPTYGGYFWPPPASKKLEKYLSLARIFLDRSSGHAIHISIWLPHRPQAGDPTSAFKMLFKEAHRWRTAYLRFAPTTAEYLHYPSNFPQLESLNIEVCASAPSRKVSFPMSIFQSHPNLKELVFHRHANHEYPDGRTIYDNIERFSGLPRELEYLRAARSTLRECTLVGRLTLMTLPHTPIVFSSLKTLAVRKHIDRRSSLMGTQLETLFRYIDAPILEKLSIEGAAGPIFGEATLIVGDIVNYTLRSSTSTLQYLKLHISGVTRHLLRQVLAAAPGLLELELVHWSSRRFELLDPEDTRRHLSPNLQLLRVAIPDTNLHFRVSFHEFSNLTSILERFRISPQLSDRPTRKLEIELIFKSPWTCFDGQQILEGWYPATSNESERSREVEAEYSRLFRWAEHLAKDFIERHTGASRKYGFVNRPLHPEKFRALDMSKLDGFLRVVENYNVQEPILLEATKIKIIMADIASLPDEVVVQDHVYHFRARAAKLVERWSKVLSDAKIVRKRWDANEDGTRLRLSGSTQ